METFFGDGAPAAVLAVRADYGDYEGNGSKSIVEAKYENGVLLPIRGKSCSTSAIPSLGEKFKTFHQFASSSLSDIYTPARLKGSAVFEANELSSGILVNNGKGSFTFKALPSAAQNAPMKFTFKTKTIIAVTIALCGCESWATMRQRTVQVKIKALKTCYLMQKKKVLHLIMNLN